MVYDIVPDLMKIFDSVQDIKLVATDYPAKWEKFPAIIYRTNHEPYRFDAKNVEQMTKWTVILEVYGKEDLSVIVESLNTKFKQIGMQGKNRDANMAGIKRKVCEFRGALDNETKIMYKS